MDRVEGFTLIELLLIVVIIGLLAAIALPRFAGARDKAHRSQMQTDLRTLVSAQEAYFDDTGAYSSTVGPLDYNQTPGVTVTVTDVTGNGWSAQATHESTSSTCGLYIGNAAVPNPPSPANDGIVDCN